MNETSIYRFPEKIKEIYTDHFPDENSLKYGNLPTKIDDALDSLFVEESDIIPKGGEEENE